MKNLMPVIVLASLLLSIGSKEAAAQNARRIRLTDNTDIMVITLTPDKTVLSMSGLSSERIKRVPPFATLGIYYPSGCRPDSKIPLFFAMSPDAGNGISTIPPYSPFADKLRFAVAALDIPAEQDIEEARYYYMLHTIYFFKKKGILSGQPVWIGGFSGGAKWSLHLGALGGDRFDGILAAGCNEDFASLGFRQMHNPKALNVPIVMLNGTVDETAGTNDWNYYPMLWTMKKTGFTNVHVIVYDGGHSLPYQETLDAFIWLKRCYAKKTNASK
jgi:predicted esterase